MKHTAAIAAAFVLVAGSAGAGRIVNDVWVPDRPSNPNSTPVFSYPGTGPHCPCALVPVQWDGVVSWGRATTPAYAEVPVLHAGQGYSDAPYDKYIPD